jgi:hypothetical protein
MFAASARLRVAGADAEGCSPDLFHNRCDLVGRHLPSTPSLDPYIDVAVVTAAALPTIFSLQGDLAGDDSHVTIELHLTAGELGFVA